MATAGDESVTLSWAPVSGAASYNVYLGLASGVSPANGSTFQGATSPHVFSGLSVGATYYFVVTAANSVGEGPASGEVSATPFQQDTTPPKVLFVHPRAGALSVAPNSTIVIGFSEPVDDASVAAGISVSGASSGPVSGTFSQAEGRATFTPGAALHLSETYTVSIAASVADLAGNTLGTAGSSSFTVRPIAPSGLAGIKGNGAVSLTWGGVPGASGYAIYRGTATGGPYTAIGTSPGLAFTDRAATNGTAYFYVVTATTAAGESGYSNEVSVTPNGVNQATQPGNLRADPGNTQALITWDSTGAADQYHLYRGTSAGGPYTQVASNLNSVTYRDSGLTNGTRYFYVVQSKSGSTTSAYSSEASVVPQAGLLAAPTNLTAATGTTWVQLSWDAVAGASAYVVYQVTDHQQHLTLTSGATTNQALITGLTDGSPYSFSVAALNAAHQPGTPSAEVTVNPTFVLAPQPVSGLQAWSPGNGIVHLEWASAPGATGYKIKRSTTSGGPYTVINTTGSPSYDDGSLGAGTYFYVVQATSNSGSTSAADSAQVSASPQQGSIRAPLNLAATAGNGCVSLTWDVVAGASNYYVTYGTASGGPYNNGGYYSHDGYDNALTVCGLQNGAPYYFVVQSYYSGSSIYSGNSGQVVGVPSASLPSAPSGLGGTVGNGQVYVTWNNVASAFSYHLYRRTETTTWSEIAAPSGLGYQDTGLTNGTRYYYAVQSENGFGRGELTAANVRTPDATLPLPPASVVATAGNGCASLRWDPVPGATLYYVTYGTQQGGPYYNGGAYSHDGYDNQLTVCGLQNGAPYYFMVQTYLTKNSAYSGYSQEAMAVPSASLPSAPSGVSATVGNGQLYVTWNNVASASAYHLYRRTDTTPWGEITTTSALGYLDTGLANATTYYYAVQSENGLGRGEITVANPRAPDANLALAPANAQAQMGNGCVTLSWDAVPGATLYYVTYGTQQGGPYYNGGYYSHDGYDTKLTMCGLQNGSAYYFVVQTYLANTSAYSGYANEVQGLPSSSLPSAPVGLSGVRGDSQITLSWNVVTGATGYHLYRRTDTTPWGEIALTSQPNYVDLEVSNDVRYFYAVQTDSSVGPGELSSVYSITPSASLGDAPTNVVANAGNGCISLSWDVVAGASMYYVTYSPTPGGPYYNGGYYSHDGYDNRLSVCGLGNGTPYYFVVQSYFSASSVYSGYSTEAVGTPSANVPSAPYTSASAGAPGEINLTWNSISNVLSYRIYRRAEGATTWAVIAEVTNLGYVDRGLTTGTHYDYALQSVSAGGAGELSNVAALAAP